MFINLQENRTKNVCGDAMIYEFNNTGFGQSNQKLRNKVGKVRLN